MYEGVNCVIVTKTISFIHGELAENKFSTLVYHVLTLVRSKSHFQTPSPLARQDFLP